MYPDFQCFGDESDLGVGHAPDLRFNFGQSATANAQPMRLQRMIWSLV